MKVYVLVAGYDYENYQIYKIFKTNEAAHDARIALGFTKLDREGLWRKEVGDDSYKEPYSNYMNVEEHFLI